MLWLAKLCVPEEEAVERADSKLHGITAAFSCPMSQTYDSFKPQNVGFLLDPCATMCVHRT